MIVVFTNTQFIKLRQTFVLLSIVFLVVQSNCVHAQVGLMGKRFLLKTDVVNGIRRPITNIELETALTRSFTLSLSYSITQTPIHGIFKGSNFIYWMDHSSDKTWNEYLPDYNRNDITSNYDINSLITLIKNQASFNPNVRITAKQRVFGLSMNFYHGGAISAPFGSYFQLGFKAGKQIISGSFNAPYIYAFKNDFIYQYFYNGVKRVDFKDVNVSFISLFMGGGKNYLLNSRMMLDLNFGTSLNVTTPKDDSDNIFSSLIAHKNGANLAAFSDNEKSITISQHTSKVNFGLYLNLKLGILLF